MFIKMADESKPKCKQKGEEKKQIKNFHWDSRLRFHFVVFKSNMIFQIGFRLR